MFDAATYASPDAGTDANTSTKPPQTRICAACTHTRIGEHPDVVPGIGSHDSRAPRRPRLAWRRRESLTARGLLGLTLDCGRRRPGSEKARDLMADVPTFNRHELHTGHGCRLVPDQVLPGHANETRAIKTGGCFPINRIQPDPSTNLADHEPGLAVVRAPVHVHVSIAKLGLGGIPAQRQRGVTRQNCSIMRKGPTQTRS